MDQSGTTGRVSGTRRMGWIGIVAVLAMLVRALVPEFSMALAGPAGQHPVERPIAAVSADCHDGASLAQPGPKPAYDPGSDPGPGQPYGPHCPFCLVQHAAALPPPPQPEIFIPAEDANSPSLPETDAAPQRRLPSPIQPRAPPV
ncbi:hypothetical protein SAE02_68080 [Skermanella aerolata]|uniref:DUF2946 domain-containing protein n=1 Tax=Skermanella aerolata TaxID=393310 RepID=A0A512E2H5_9PROT|nr:DUF2946 family protein [Skermanella aerolata]GEO42660.1 hypothetical protein SAE02_68080 [Skermanella aerolata]